MIEAGGTSGTTRTRRVPSAKSSVAASDGATVREGMSKLQRVVPDLSPARQAPVTCQVGDPKPDPQHAAQAKSLPRRTGPVFAVIVPVIPPPGPLPSKRVCVENSVA